MKGKWWELVQKVTPKAIEWLSDIQGGDNAVFTLPKDVGWDGENPEFAIRHSLEARQMFSFLLEEERNYIEEKILGSPGQVFHYGGYIPKFIPVRSTDFHNLELMVNDQRKHLYYGRDRHGLMHKMGVGDNCQGIVTLYEFIDDAFIDHQQNAFGAAIVVYGSATDVSRELPRAFNHLG